MIIDMHVHTEVSMDADATAEAYCRLIQQYRRFHPFDGFVITEHRTIHPYPEDYQRLSERFDMLIFQGVEIDTNLGHMLLFGNMDALRDKIDLSNRAIKVQEVLKVMKQSGGVAIPSHPYRGSAFGAAFDTNYDDIKDITIVEELNGANDQEENDLASSLVARNGLKGIGGSDSHYANKTWFLNCATEFFNPIQTIGDMINELNAGNFQPVRLDNSMLEDR